MIAKVKREPAEVTGQLVAVNDTLIAYVTGKGRPRDARPAARNDVPLSAARPRSASVPLQTAGFA